MAAAKTTRRKPGSASKKMRSTSKPDSFTSQAAAKLRDATTKLATPQEYAVKKAQQAAGLLGSARHETARLYREYANILDREASNVTECAVSGTPWCVSPQYEADRLQIAHDLVVIQAGISYAQEGERKAYIDFLGAVTAAAAAVGVTQPRKTP